MDTVTKEQRSLNMAKIKSKHTIPEIKVRKILTNFGYRYRLHAAKLPGKPDIVVSKINTVFFINGCFWHKHTNCSRATQPKTNTEYWGKKLERNIKKQNNDIDKLKKIGKRIAIVWECQTRNEQELNSLVRRKLNEKENI